MFTKCYASALVGIEAMTVEVEVNITPGLGMFLVGLPDNAVRESQERIRSAFDNSGLKMPGKKVVVNLAPADVRKEGSSLDLTIAVAILAAAGQVAPDRLGSYIIMGELSLDGTVKPIRGALPIAVNARRNGFRGFILPRENAAEAAVAEGLETIAAGSLKEVVDFLNGDAAVPPYVHETTEGDEAESPYEEDFADVKGQAHVKRALEVAAAGGHNVIMIGSPGSGKTMLARRMPTIMPPMTTAESLETTKIHSIAGKPGSTRGLMTHRPFRAPHHLASQVALIGGGTNPQPGEISLAHNGILFLDELPEFGRSVLGKPLWYLTLGSGEKCVAAVSAPSRHDRAGAGRKCAAADSCSAVFPAFSAVCAAVPVRSVRICLGHDRLVQLQTVSDSITGGIFL